MTLDIDTPTAADTYAPRFASTIQVRIMHGMRIYRHTQTFPRTRDGWTKAKRLVKCIRDHGGLSLRHVETSAQWVRTGKMSGVVQVNRVTATDFTALDPVNRPGEYSYKLTGPVANHWGAKPIEGAVWDFGTQYDYTGRTPAEIKASVEGNRREAIYSCKSMEHWPYQDTELVAALANTSTAKAA